MARPHGSWATAAVFVTLLVALCDASFDVELGGAAVVTPAAQGSRRRCVLCVLYTGDNRGELLSVASKFAATPPLLFRHATSRGFAVTREHTTLPFVWLNKLHNAQVRCGACKLWEAAIRRHADVSGGGRAVCAAFPPCHTPEHRLS